MTNVGESLRFLFYSHDALGLGHVRRNLSIAAALIDAAPQATVLIATGLDQVDRLGLPPNVGILKVPSIRKVHNGTYVSRRLLIPATDIWRLRAELLKAAVTSFQPSVILVDRHPFGVSSELLPALEVHRSRGGRTALGLRDILDSSESIINEWQSVAFEKSIVDYYDRILIYGQPEVFDPISQYEFPDSVSARVSFCGYVIHKSATNGHDLDPLPNPFAEMNSLPTVLATPGGGEDGFPVLKTFIVATSTRLWNGIAVSGPMASAKDIKMLRRIAARTGVLFNAFVPSLSRWFKMVDVLVCMGGYNTLVEAAYLGVPTVCVPRIYPRSEQLIRAMNFENLGLIQVLPPYKLGPQNLRDAVSSAFRFSRKDLAEKAKISLRFDGATQAASHLLELTGTASRGPGNVSSAEI